MALIEVEGWRGVVFQRITGQTMGQAMEGKIFRLDYYARMLAGLQAELHQLSAPGFPSLHERVIWSLGQTSLLSYAQKVAIYELLQRLPDEDRLCHADFHPGNIILAEEGPMIIDWEGSLRGEPGGDVAFTCLIMRSELMTGSGTRGWILHQIGLRFEKVYLAAYQRARGPVEHLDEWLAILAACRMDEENAAKIPFFEGIIRRVLPDW